MLRQGHRLEKSRARRVRFRYALQVLGSKKDGRGEKKMQGHPMGEFIQTKCGTSTLCGEVLPLVGSLVAGADVNL